MLRFIMYFVVIIITTLFFGFQSGLIEIKNPNKVLYDKSKHWTVED